MKRTIGGMLASVALVTGLLLPEVSASAAVVAQPVSGVIDFPTGFTFAPDGRIFYVERFSGEVRTLDTTTSVDSLYFDVPNIDTQGEHGLLGIAVHPDYPTAPFVYVFAVRNVPGVGLRTEIIRITESGGVGSSMQALLSEPTTGTVHVGGRIMFAPDGTLVAIIGENGTRRAAQNLNNNRGKIVRMNPDGTIPANNPFPGSYVAAYGFRNSFGFTFDPLTGNAWESENGPECNDEVNLVRPGRNYGWGANETCLVPPQPPRNTNRDGPNPQQPKRFYTPTIAPTGVSFCSGCGLGAGSEGSLYMGTWNTGQIRRLGLSADRLGIASDTVAYTHSDGILGVESGPDGTLYFSDPQRIYRLVQV